MLFHQFPFLFLFLPAVILSSRLIRVQRARLLLLTFWSLFFYLMASDWRSLLALSLMMPCSFFLGRMVAKERGRQLLPPAIALTLAPLAALKYTGFFLSFAGYEFNSIAGFVGISFYTFQQISYLVDARRNGQAERNFLNYTFYISFFPQLISGPIVRHGHMAKQLSRDWSMDERSQAEGWPLLIIGCFKKLLIADNCAVVANSLFSAQEPYAFALSFWATLSYTLQIYFDFSAYSDMAVGLGRILGFDIPVNFDSPYKARGFGDFWRRWHITLSSWIRDYLYIPLGGNRKGAPRRAFNVLAAMLLCGLWHGPALTFVLWGGLHGLCIVLEQLFKRWAPRFHIGPLAVPITFVIAALLWVPFRAESLTKAMDVYAGFLHPGSWEWSSQYWWVLSGLVLLPLPNSMQWARWIANLSDSLPGRNGSFSVRYCAYCAMGYLASIGLMYGFYAHGIDRNLYAVLPVKRYAYGINTQHGDFRSNMLTANSLWGSWPKVVVVGPSYTTQLGRYIMTVKGQAFQSGTLGIQGPVLSNGLRTALCAAELPDIRVIVLGLSPLDLVELECPPSVFENQCVGPLRPLGFKIEESPLSSFSQVSLSVADVCDMAVGFKDDKYYQFHNFLEKIRHLQPEAETPLDKRYFLRFTPEKMEEAKVTERRHMQANMKIGKPVPTWAKRWAGEKLYEKNWIYPY